MNFIGHVHIFGLYWKRPRTWESVGGGGKSLSFEAETDTETNEIDQGQDPETTTLTQMKKVEYWNTI